MSRETMDWLNTNTLIGFTEKRGTAWHYRAGADNHYPGAVPVEEVKRRLFAWEPVETPLYVPAATVGGEVVTYAEVPGRKAITRSDSGHVLGVFKDAYVPHPYTPWLIDNVASILDDTLNIGSAGLLKGGAVAWVSVEVPDTITTPEGVEFRPNLLACTSLDGTVATTYKRVVTNVVCDNTMSAALGESGQQFKVRHTSKSLGRLMDARRALGVVYDIADDFQREVAELCKISVTDREFDKIVDAMVPLPEVKPGARGTRARTIAENKRDSLWDLWRSDNRSAPWHGTAYGAWQTFNTYQHHKINIRGKDTTRAERNMLRAVEGLTDKTDADTVKGILAAV